MIDEDSVLKRRELLTKAVISGTGFLGVSGALAANRINNLPIDVSIIDESDKFGIHRVSQLDVRVVNNGKKPLELSFSILREDRQTRFYWDVESESKNPIYPGETKQYQLCATNPGMAITYGEKYVLIAENLQGSSGSTVENHTRNNDTLTPIRNPSVNFWLVSTQTGNKKPFRWNKSTWSKQGDSTAIIQTDLGANFVVTGDKSGSWTMSGLTQRVPFIDSVKMEAVPEALTRPSGLMSGGVCGLEVIDRSHRIWAVYADVPERRQEYRPGELDYHVEYIPASGGDPSEFSLDLSQIYETRGWERPPGRPITIDGVQYQASTMTLHPFAASYDEGVNAGMELTTIST